MNNWSEQVFLEFSDDKYIYENFETIINQSINQDKIKHIFVFLLKKN